MFDGLCYIMKVHCKRWLYLSTPERELKLSQDPWWYNSAVKGKNTQMVQILVKDTLTCLTDLSLYVNTYCTHLYPRAFWKVLNEGSELRKFIYLQMKVRLSPDDPVSLI